MMRPLHFAAATAALLAGMTLAAAAAAPATDLDAFMQRVLARRDDNWTKLQQYVLDERETLQFTGPGGAPLYGFRREYTWFVRQGFFIRSPLTADGAAVGEAERRRYEASWLAREKVRERRREREPGRADAPPADGTDRVEDVLRQSLEPRFISAAYFLRFKFEPGHYALVGRDTMDGRPVLEIEYYPARLFDEGRTRPARSARRRDDQVEERLNKISLVRLWIDAAQPQILKYTFDIAEMGFLPGRAIVRVDPAQASMRMTEAFPSVWLPQTITMRIRVTLATGDVEGRYNVTYHDYRQAKVTTKVK